jgi:hypothetical protein
MSKISRSQAMDMLDLLTDDCLSMTDWELNFIDDMAKRKDEGNYFSQKQLDIIERIHTEYMT